MSFGTKRFFKRPVPLTIEERKKSGNIQTSLSVLEKRFEANEKEVNKLADLTRDIERAQKDLELLQDEIVLEQNALSVVKIQFSGAKGDLGTLEQEIAEKGLKAQNRLDNVINEYKIQGLEIEARENVKNYLIDIIKDFQEQKKKLRDDNEALNKTLTVNKNFISSHKDKMESLEKKIESYKLALSDETANARSIKAEIKILEDKKESLKKDVERINKEKKEEFAQLRVFKISNEEAQAEDEYKKGANEIRKHKVQLEQMTAKFKHVKSKLDEYKKAGVESNVL